MTNPESWLNGWPRKGNTVLVGTGIYCAGCGRDYGDTTVIIPENWRPPDKEPDYPFEKDTCPVCAEKPPEYWTVKGLSKLPLSLLRQAIVIKKSH